MEQYVGLDVSLKETSLCVVNQTGRHACRPAAPPPRHRSRYRPTTRSALATPPSAACCGFLTSLSSLSRSPGASWMRSILPMNADSHLQRPVGIL